MDLDTAKRLESRLKEELTALTDHLCIATVLSKVPNYVECELIRLGLCIDEESISSIAEDYEAKIPVENEFHIFFMCGLTLETEDIDSIVQFKKKLEFELHGIERGDRPLPFVSQYIKRMIERLEDEINNERARVAYFIRRPRATVVRSPYSRFFIEHLNHCVKDVLHTVVQNNPEDSSSDQVLEILRRNYGIRINHFVTSIVRKMYYEATFPYKY